MQAVKEITKWEGATQPNHTYLLDGTKMVAYIKFSEGEPYYFKQPIQIDKRGRKFEELKTNPFKQEPKSSLIVNIGSKGDRYFVDPEANTCTCPGFTFRGACKHITKI